MKKVFFLLILSFLAALSVPAAEITVSNVADLSAAEKAGWIARSTAELTVPAPGVLRVQGKDSKRFCGMALKAVPALDCAGAIKCKVKMNFGRHVYLGISGSEGYFDIYLPVKPNVEQSLTIPLDIKNGVPGAIKNSRTPSAISKCS